MDLLLCWLIAPAGLLVAVVGLSLLAERLTGFTLPWTMRPALGLAIAIVLAQFGTATATTAKLTLPAILLLALLGLVLGRGVPERRPSGAEVWVAIAVFVLYASPFLIIGEATIAGYIKLDDTATWLNLTDHIFEFGRGIGDLAPSTHQQVLVDYLGGSYPIGSFVPTALLSERKSPAQDVAFTIQPSMAFAAATMGLLLFELARRLVRGTGLAALIAILASLASLLVGYYLWGGVKEMVVAALLPLGPLLAGRAAGAGWPRYAWVPLSLAVAAMIVVLGPGGAVWVVPTLLPAAVAVQRRYGARGVLRIAWPVAALSVVLILPVVFTPTGIFNPLINSSLTESTELGNLAGPLSFFHLAGIWPALDFRYDPHLKPAVIALSAICLAIAALTAAVVARLGEGDGVPLAGYVFGGAVGALAIAYFGSPWVDAKAMASLSPALLAAALIGITMLGQRTGFRIEAVVLGTLVAGTVIWSAFLAYQGVWFAPFPFHRAGRDRRALRRRRARARHRGLDLRTAPLPAQARPGRRQRPPQPGGPPDQRGSAQKGEYVDLDQIDPAELDTYALLVVRRSAAESQPPGRLRPRLPDRSLRRLEATALARHAGRAPAAGNRTGRRRRAGMLRSAAAGAGGGRRRQAGRRPRRHAGRDRLLGRLAAPGLEPPPGPTLSRRAAREH